MGYRNGMPFAFWCHKVLPLVYDNSLSYYEFLCKLAKILQEVMEHDVEQDETIQKCVEDIQTVSEDIHSINLRIEDIIEHNGQQDENLQELEEDLANFHHEVGEQIGDIEERIRGVILDLETIKSNLYNDYNESANYSVGDLVSYEGELYVCTANTTGEFNPNDWSNTNLSAQIEELKNNYTTLGTEIAQVMYDIESVGHCIANEYSSLNSYVVGDYCMHENVLYKCNTNTTGEWTSADWTAVKIVNEMGQGGGGQTGDVFPEWEDDAIYELFDCVTYNGKVYMATEYYVPYEVPSAQSTGWYEIAQERALVNSYEIMADSYSVNDGERGEIEGVISLYFHDASDGIGVHIATSSWNSGETPHFEPTKLIDEINNTNYNLFNYGVRTYDASATYNRGDLIVYARRIRRCLYDNTTGSFDPDKWEMTDIFTELNNIKITLKNLNLYNGNLVDRFSTNVTEVI